MKPRRHKKPWIWNVVPIFDYTSELPIIVVLTEGRAGEYTLDIEWVSFQLLWRESGQMQHMLDVPTPPSLQSQLVSAGKSRGVSRLLLNDFSPEQITILLIGKEGGTLAVLPTFKLDKVGHKTRDGTFEEDVIAEKDILSGDPCFKCLVYRWKSK